MKILHTADIHLREYEDLRWQTLLKLIDTGKKEKIEILAISGDLFDKDINAENLKLKIREIFSNTGFKIVVIPGNHDSETYKGGMYFGEDLHVFYDLNEPFEYRDIVIWGFPFEKLSADKIINKLNGLKNRLPSDKTNLLLYHGELLNSFYSRRDFGDEGDETYMPVKLSYFDDLKIDYILGGHFHCKFDMWQLDNGGYFIYPGSPVSITKKETGKRKVNLFEVGKSPKEYPMDSPYFEDIVIDLDPFEDRDPMEIITGHLKNIPPEALIILTVKGYINSEMIKTSEEELKNKIKKIIKGKPGIEENLKLEYRDIHKILENDLFKDFLKKVDKIDCNGNKRKELCDLAIKAMADI
jgi:DNA repair exonuclease SbcCD nuclease subunit